GRGGARAAEPSGKEPKPTEAARGTTAPAERLRARQFVLVDAGGARRATLGVDEDWPWDAKKESRSAPGLYLRDDKGQPRLALFTTVKDGVSVLMLDENKKPALALALGQDRQVAIAFLDGRGATRCLTGIRKDDKAGLVPSRT